MSVSDLGKTATTSLPDNLVCCSLNITLITELFLSGVVTCEGLKFLNKSIIVFQVLHTSMGDIHLRLYPEECPKTVENFTTHCRNGYYDNLIFHRVIKGFMIQTGDPLGDGTGGQSIWGTEFEDEFHKRYVYFFPI